MSLTEPDSWISHIRLFSKTHVTGDRVYKRQAYLDVETVGCVLVKRS